MNSTINNSSNKNVLSRQLTNSILIKVKNEHIDEVYVNTKNYIKSLKQSEFFI